MQKSNFPEKKLFLYRWFYYRNSNGKSQFRSIETGEFFPVIIPENLCEVVWRPGNFSCKYKGKSLFRSMRTGENEQRKVAMQDHQLFPGQRLLLELGDIYCTVILATLKFGTCENNLSSIFATCAVIYNKIAASK